ncbi:MAG: DUF4259 domain-containing protein [bacterium]
MGTWGSGNLDSDGALDHLAERSRALIEDVWTALRSPTSWEADESDHDALFVDLEWLGALGAAKCLSLWDLPSVADLEPVLVRWLAGWSAYFDGLAGPEFKAERRAVIDATFDRLRALCAERDRQRA